MAKQHPRKVTVISSTVSGHSDDSRLGRRTLVSPSIRTTVLTTDCSVPVCPRYLPPQLDLELLRGKHTILLTSVSPGDKAQCLALNEPEFSFTRVDTEKRTHPHLSGNFCFENSNLPLCVSTTLNQWLPTFWALFSLSVEWVQIWYLPQRAQMRSPWGRHVKCLAQHLLKNIKFVITAC